MTIVSPGGGAAFQRRTSSNGFSVGTTHTGVTAPHWVRLVRNGDTLTSFRSTNGTNWTQIGRVSIPMAQEVHIGLAVTSHNNGTLCEATFSNVTVTGQ